MKKLLVGCLVIIVLGAIVLGVGSYFLYRAASPLINDAREYVQGMAELNEIDKAITNKSPYQSPASGELTQTQVQRFARVQDQVRGALGQRMKEIEERYQYLQSSSDQGQQPSITEVLSSLRELGNLFMQARRYQVDALNKEGFSEEEYAWVRTRVLQAAGMEVTSMIDLSKLQEAIQQGTGVQDINMDRVPRPDVPVKNRELVKPYLEKMNQWLPLVFFGL